MKRNGDSSSATDIDTAIEALETKRIIIEQIVNGCVSEKIDFLYKLAHHATEVRGFANELVSTAKSYYDKIAEFLERQKSNDNDYSTLRNYENAMTAVRFYGNGIEALALTIGYFHFKNTF